MKAATYIYIYSHANLLQLDTFSLYNLLLMQLQSVFVSVRAICMFVGLLCVILYVLIFIALCILCIGLYVLLYIIVLLCAGWYVLLCIRLYKFIYGTVSIIMYWIVCIVMNRIACIIT